MEQHRITELRSNTKRKSSKILIFLFGLFPLLTGVTLGIVAFAITSRGEIPSGTLLTVSATLVVFGILQGITLLKQGWIRR